METIQQRPISSRDKFQDMRERELEVNVYDYEEFRIQQDRQQEYYEYRQSGN